MPANLRRIDQGTKYDISMGVRQLIRKIETGEIRPRDVVILTRESVALNKSCKVGMFHFGTGSNEDIHWMCATAKNRVEPS